MGGLGGEGEGKREGISGGKWKREKGSGSFLRSILTLHTAARARTNETKRFPGWSKPPNLRYTCIIRTHIYAYVRTCYTHTHIRTYIHTYIHTYIGGWEAETNREIVSFRSCLRAQLYVRSEWISKMIAHPFSLFP